VIKLNLFIFLLLTQIIQSGCTTVKYMNTVNQVDIERFMGDWYVVAGRTTFLEKGAHNSLERYTWNKNKNRIDIEFTFNKNKFDGPLKTIKQKAWIENKETKAHWKVQPLWPLKLDYLVLALDPDYAWTIIGVPSQSYVWIMTREKNISKQRIDQLISKLKEIEYSTDNIKIIQHN